MVVRCDKCHCVGHSEAECKKVWVPKSENTEKLNKEPLSYEEINEGLSDLQTCIDKIIEDDKIQSVYNEEQKQFISIDKAANGENITKTEQNHIRNTDFAEELKKKMQIKERLPQSRIQEKIVTSTKQRRIATQLVKINRIKLRCIQLRGVCLPQLLGHLVKN